MPLYYLDESREPRDCPECVGSGVSVSASNSQAGTIHCPTCHGRGRIGDLDSEPDVEVARPYMPYTKWYHRVPFRPQWHGPYPTEAEALAAAREAAGKER